MSRHYLFFDAADGQNAPAQRNFSRHGTVTERRPLREGGDQGRRHCDTGGWSILWDGTRWQVQVDIIFLVEAVLKTKLTGAGAGVGERSLGRFFHHIAELPGECQMTMSFHDGGLDGGQVASRARPGNAGCHAYLILILCLSIEKLLWAEVIRYFIGIDFRFCASPIGYLARYFAHHRRYFAFQ